MRKKTDHSFFNSIFPKGILNQFYYTLCFVLLPILFLLLLQVINFSLDFYMLLTTHFALFC